MLFLKVFNGLISVRIQLKINAGIRLMRVKAFGSIVPADWFKPAFDLIQPYMPIQINRLGL